MENSEGFFTHYAPDFPDPDWGITVLQDAYVTTSAEIFIRQLTNAATIPVVMSRLAGDDIELLAKESVSKYVLVLMETQVAQNSGSDPIRLSINGIIHFIGGGKMLNSGVEEFISFSAIPLTPATAHNPRIRVTSYCSHPLAQTIYRDLWDSIMTDFDVVLARPLFGYGMAFFDEENEPGKQTGQPPAPKADQGGAGGRTYYSLEQKCKIVEGWFEVKKLEGTTQEDYITQYPSLSLKTFQSYITKYRKGKLKCRETP